MADCKWCYDEFCTNDKCPMCADYCPVPNDEGVCRYEERISDEKITCLNFLERSDDLSQSAGCSQRQ